MSVGELERVLAVGGDPAKVVFLGVGKQRFEFTDRHDVKATAGLGKSLQHGQARVGLHRITNPVRAPRQCGSGMQPVRRASELRE